MADNPKGPYGSVEYADPGYQSDKKKRYPIDSAEHCRAALSYINQADNASKYSAEQLKSIKGRIKAAAKKFGIDISEDSSTRSDMASEIETRSANVQVDGVNFAQRIITVLAVPYESPTDVIYRQEPWSEVFSRGAFDGIDPQSRRIPATAVLEVPNSNHENGHLVGKVISTDPYRQEGLVTEVKISRTDRGDETLELANDDALSASVGFMVKNRLDQEMNRQTRSRRINRAFLDHLAFVGIPAYTGARVLAVRSADTQLESTLDRHAPTPVFDEWYNDPIIQWAMTRNNGS